ncbi:MAG: amidohydrolase family protein [Acidobacteriota bacterium]
MIRRLSTLLVLAALAACTNFSEQNQAGSWGGGSPPRSGSTVAIVDVSVLPMDREVVLPHQTVLIVGQRITALGPSDSVDIPEDALQIDGSGRFLMPGLSDMHAHLRRKDGHLPQDYLHQGITVIRNMAGDPDHLRLREALEAGEHSGPLFYTTGRPLTSSDLFPSHRLVETAAEGRAAVREQSAAGFDYVKVYSLLSKDAFDGIAAEAAALGMPVIGHVSDLVRLHHSIERGMSSVEHFYGYFWELESETSSLAGEWAPQPLFHAVEIDPAKLRELAELTAEAGVWNCPTLWRKNHYLTAPVAQEAWNDPALRALGEANRLALVKALHDAGAGLLTGTDDRAEVIHEELALFVEAGLTPYETLRAATVNAATYFAAADDFGTVAVGRRANLVLLDANPLADIRHTRAIHGVLINGDWMPLTTTG